LGTGSLKTRSDENDSDPHKKKESAKNIDRVDSKKGKILAKNHTSLIEDAWTDLLRKHRTWGEIVCRPATNLPEEAKNLPVVSSILHTDFSRKRSR
jgi:hypothetical protein